MFSCFFFVRFSWFIAVVVLDVQPTTVAVEMYVCLGGMHPDDNVVAVFDASRPLVWAINWGMDQGGCSMLPVRFSQNSGRWYYMFSS